MYEARAELAADPSSVAAARRFVAEELETAGAPDDVWNARQVVSELATNAVMHAATPFVVEVRVDDEVVAIAVTDRKPLVPATKRRFSAEATTGRGLRLVDMLSRTWGVDSAATTKTVWAELRRAEAGDDASDVSPDALLATLLADDEDDPDQAGSDGAAVVRTSDDRERAIGRESGRTDAA